MCTWIFSIKTTRTESRQHCSNLYIIWNQMGSSSHHNVAHKEPLTLEKKILFIINRIVFYILGYVHTFGGNAAERNVNIVVNNSFAPHAKIQREWKGNSRWKPVLLRIPYCVLSRCIHMHAKVNIRIFATTGNLNLQTGLCGPLTHWHRILVYSFILAQHTIKCAWTSI